MTPDHLGIAFAAYLLIGALVAVGLCRILGMNERRSRRQFVDHGRDRLGISPVADFCAECETRANRGRFRHATRHTKDAA